MSRSHLQLLDIGLARLVAALEMFEARFQMLEAGHASFHVRVECSQVRDPSDAAVVTHDPEDALSRLVSCGNGAKGIALEPNAVALDASEPTSGVT